MKRDLNRKFAVVFAFLFGLQSVCVDAKKGVKINRNVMLGRNKNVTRRKNKNFKSYLPFFIPAGLLGLGGIYLLLKPKRVSSFGRSVYDICKDFEPRIREACGIASTVNVLKHFGIKITQEQLIEMLIKEDASGSMRSDGTISNFGLISNVLDETLEKNNLFAYEVGVDYLLPKDDSYVKFIKEAILSFYKLVDRNPFVIDSPYYNPLIVGHMVNVVEVTDSQIILYDNLGKGSIKQFDLDAFAKGYLDRYGKIEDRFKDIKSIELQGIRYTDESFFKMFGICKTKIVGSGTACSSVESRNLFWWCYQATWRIFNSKEYGPVVCSYFSSHDSKGGIERVSDVVALKENKVKFDSK